MRLHRNRVHTRDALLEKTGNAAKGSRRAAADRDGIDAPLHLLKDLARGSFVVVVRVGRVVELRGHESGGIGCQQIPRALDRALHPLALRCADHLGAKGAHDDGLFLRKFFRDEQAHLVAARHADQSEADTGVSSRGFNDGTAGLELAFALGALDQANSSAVFHTAARVQVFEFGENIGRSRRGQLLHLQHRRFADELRYIVANAQARV